MIIAEAWLSFHMTNNGCSIQGDARGLCRASWYFKIVASQNKNHIVFMHFAIVRVHAVIKVCFQCEVQCFVSIFLPWECMTIDETTNYPDRQLRAFLIECFIKFFRIFAIAFFSCWLWEVFSLLLCAGRHCRCHENIGESYEAIHVNR